MNPPTTLLWHNIWLRPLPAHVAPQAMTLDTSNGPEKLTSVFTVLKQHHEINVIQLPHWKWKISCSTQAPWWSFGQDEPVSWDSSWSLPSSRPAFPHCRWDQQWPRPSSCGTFSFCILSSTDLTWGWRAEGGAWLAPRPDGCDWWVSSHQCGVGSLAMESDGEARQDCCFSLPLITCIGNMYTYFIRSLCSLIDGWPINH